MAEGLVKTGLKGKELATALEAAAVKAAQLKWGPDFAKQMLSLDSQAARLQTNISGIFGGLRIEGLLEGFSTLVALFDKNTSSGKALKFLFETLFQPIVDGAVRAIPDVERLFIQAEIGALKAYIAVKHFTDSLGIDGKEAAYYAVLAVVGALVLVFALLTVAVLTVGLFLAFVFLPFIVIGLLIYAFVKGWIAIFGAVGDAVSSAGSAIMDGIGAAVDWLSGLDLGSIASDLMDGLVNGITSAGGAVLGAITGVVGGAIDAAKSLLGIASPSKVFAQIGVHTGEGMAQGVDASAGDVQDSMSSMVAPPDPGKGGAKGGSKGSGGSFDFKGAAFTFNGVKDAEQAESLFAGVLTRILEGDLTVLGGT